MFITSEHLACPFVKFLYGKTGLALSFMHSFKWHRWDLSSEDYAEKV